MRKKALLKYVVLIFIVFVALTFAYISDNKRCSVNITECILRVYDNDPVTEDTIEHVMSDDYWTQDTDEKWRIPKSDNYGNSMELLIRYEVKRMFVKDDYYVDIYFNLDEQLESYFMARHNTGIYPHDMGKQDDFIGNAAVWLAGCTKSLSDEEILDMLDGLEYTIYITDEQQALTKKKGILSKDDIEVEHVNIDENILSPLN